MSLGRYLGEQVEPGKTTSGVPAQEDLSDVRTHGSGKTALAIAPYSHSLLREDVGEPADVREAERTLTGVDPSRLFAQDVPTQGREGPHDRVGVY